MYGLLGGCIWCVRSVPLKSPVIPLVYFWPTSGMELLLIRGWRCRYAGWGGGSSQGVFFFFFSTAACHLSCVYCCFPRGISPCLNCLTLTPSSEPTESLEGRYRFKTSCCVFFCITLRVSWFYITWLKQDKVCSVDIGGGVMWGTQTALRECARELLSPITTHPHLHYFDHPFNVTYHFVWLSVLHFPNGFWKTDYFPT